MWLHHPNWGTLPGAGPGPDPRGQAPAGLLAQGYEPSDALADEIIAAVKAQLASYKAPQWVEFVAELPKTATGKIQRFMLRQALSAGG